jgi:hypothetical protein
MADRGPLPQVEQGRRRVARTRWKADELARTFTDSYWEEMRRSRARCDGDAPEAARLGEMVRRAWVEAEARGEVRWTSPRSVEVAVAHGTGGDADRAQAAMRAAGCEAEHWKRLLLVAGAVTAVLAPDPIYAVGGTAVEGYTQGAYVTRGIDFAADLFPERIAARLPDLGFARLATGSWLHQPLRMVVGFAARPDPSEMARVVTVRLGGVSVRLRALEDTLVDGLQAAVHRGDATSEMWVRYMLAAHWDRIGWRLLDRQAARAGCAGLVDRLKGEVRPS